MFIAISTSSGSDSHDEQTRFLIGQVPLHVHTAICVGIHEHCTAAEILVFG
jgi:hypothetical protein